MISRAAAMEGILAVKGAAADASPSLTMGTEPSSERERETKREKGGKMWRKRKAKQGRTAQMNTKTITMKQKLKNEG